MGIAMQASQTGWRDGPFPKRRGAAKMRAKVAPRTTEVVRERAPLSLRRAWSGCRHRRHLLAFQAWRRFFLNLMTGCKPDTGACTIFWWLATSIEELDHLLWHRVSMVAVQRT